MKRIAALLCCLMLLLPCAQAEEGFTGQSLKTFVSYYSDDVYLINDSTGYHLLPLIIAQRDSGNNDGRVIFELLGDTLSLYGVTGKDGDTIEHCEITLTAPAGMVVGNAIYNDFAISAYHCYALLMAMEGASRAAVRYGVVELIEKAIVDGGGTGVLQRGVYTLTGVRAETSVTLSFTNNRAVPDETEPPEDEPDGEADPDAEETPLPEGEGIGLL